MYFGTHMIFGRVYIIGLTLKTALSYRSFQVSINFSFYMTMVPCDSSFCKRYENNLIFATLVLPLFNLFGIV